MIEVDDVLRLFFDTFLNCTDGPFTIPPASIYLKELSTSFSVAIVVASLLSVTTVALAVLHIVYIHTYVTHFYRKGFVFFLAGTSPFVSVLSLTAMFLPRTWFLAHLLGFLYFSMALWVIICLLMHIVDGRHSVVKKMLESSARITVQTPPFCCCLPCLPKLEMETKKIRFCELMVLQSPCVRLVATIISLILYFEYQNGAFFALKLLDFVVLPSLLIGIYGTHILVTTVSKLDELISYRYIVVFRLLDIFFMFFGVQHAFFDFLARVGVFGCGDSLPSLETAYFWKNLAVVVESFFVSLISTALLKPSRSALFDKYPSCRSVASSVLTHESTT